MTLKQIINVSYLVKKTCCCFAVAVGFSARLSVFLTNLALFQIRSSPILKTICLRDTYLWSPHANDNTVSIYNDSFSISLIIGLRSYVCFVIKSVDESLQAGFVRIFTGKIKTDFQICKPAVFKVDILIKYNGIKWVISI